MGEQPILPVLAFTLWAWRPFFDAKIIVAGGAGAGIGSLRMGGVIFLNRIILTVGSSGRSKRGGSGVFSDWTAGTLFISEISLHFLKFIILRIRLVQLKHIY